MRKLFQYKKQNRRGFTLTEILLAVMIVGLIAVALASLTRSAARESGVGKTRIVLRNNLASFIRTLHADVGRATRVQAAGELNGAAPNVAIPVLNLGLNMDKDGNALRTTAATGLKTTTPYWVTYCFVPGDQTSNIVPSSAYGGGTLYRISSTTGPDYPACSTSADKIVLTNVKYIPESDDIDYPVPLFKTDDSTDGQARVLRVNLIVEENSKPIVNEVVEETFVLPIGY